LGVLGMQPLATNFHCVFSVDHREVVANLGAPEKFVDVRIQEERLAETERGAEAHGGVWNRAGIDGVARAIFAGVSKVRFVHLVIGERAEPTGVEYLNLAGAFDAVGSRSVGGNVECLIGILRPIEAVGAKDLVIGIEVVVHAAKDGSVANGMIHGFAIVFIKIGLQEIEQGHTLAVWAGADDRIGGQCSVKNGGDGTRSTDGRAEILAGQVFSNAFSGTEEEEFVFFNGTANAATELFAVKTFQRLAVGGG